MRRWLSSTVKCYKISTCQSLNRLSAVNSTKLKWRRPLTCARWWQQPTCAVDSVSNISHAITCLQSIRKTKFSIRAITRFRCYCLKLVQKKQNSFRNILGKILIIRMKASMSRTSWKDSQRLKLWSRNGLRILPRISVICIVEALKRPYTSLWVMARQYECSLCSTGAKRKRSSFVVLHASP